MLKNNSQFKHNIVDKLSNYVIWQTQPKIELARALENLNNPLFKKKWPLHKALYYWPTGSWKTELVKSLARVLFDDEYWYTHISCENMQHWHEIAKLFWSPPWYIWYDKEPIFSEKNLYNPYESANKSWRLMEWLKWRGAISIILFDEIEKAHRDISQALMSVLDEWMIHLNNWKQIDISNSFILMTSNIWERNIKETPNSLWFNKTEKNVWNIRETAIRKHFSPEFLWRMDWLFEFEKIEWEWLYKVLSKLLKDLDEDVKRLRKKNVKFSITNEWKNNIIANAWNSIRDMERHFNNNIRNKLWNIINNNKLYWIEKEIIIDIDYNNNIYTFNLRNE